MQIRNLRSIGRRHLGATRVDGKLVEREHLGQIDPKGATGLVVVTASDN